MTAQNVAEPRYAQLVQAAADALKNHGGPIVFLAHVNPDGDALGSCLGLQRALRAAGKDAQMYMQVPRYLTFLPQEGEVLPSLPAWPEGALAAVLDVNNTDMARVAGAEMGTFEGQVVNINHHGTNRREAAVSLVDPSQAAAAMIVKDVVDALGVPWSREIATRFCSAPTPTPARSALPTPPRRCCGPPPIWLNTARTWPGSTISWPAIRSATLPCCARCLDQMAFSSDGLIVRSHIDEAALERTAAQWEDVKSYVNTIRNADGTELAVMFKDYGERVKLSLRSRGRVSAQNIAVSLGGGGHVAAAGASVNATYPEALTRFEAAADAELRRVALR